jgi:acyl-homoserine-lactone acylase
VGDLKASLIRTLGSPWVNTIAADRAGDAFYADITATPNVDAQMLKTCAPPSGKGPLAATQRVFILDGARSACDWPTSPTAAVPGLMTGESMPSVVRADYVANSNDSFWLTNPRARFAAHSPMVGPIDYVQGLRTRSGILEIEQRLAGADGLPGRQIDPAVVKDLLYRNKNLAADLVLNDVRGICAGGASGVTEKGRTVDLTKACAVLVSWDRRMNLDSVGSGLFTEFWKDAQKIPNLWAVAFDAKDPVNTPRGIKADPAVATSVRKALAEAVVRMEAAKLPIDAAWGEQQVATRGGLRIPVHGGDSADGVLNAQQAKLIDGVGFVPYHGSSYIQVVTFDDQGPVADAILTYGQSTDPTSPNFADQTRLHAQKQWVRLPFSKAQIAADPQLTRKVVRQ